MDGEAESPSGGPGEDAADHQAHGRAHRHVGAPHRHGDGSPASVHARHEQRRPRRVDVDDRRALEDAGELEGQERMAEDVDRIGPERDHGRPDQHPLGPETVDDDAAGKRQQRRRNRDQRDEPAELNGADPEGGRDVPAQRDQLADGRTAQHAEQEDGDDRNPAACAHVLSIPVRPVLMRAPLINDRKPRTAVTSSEKSSGGAARRQGQQPANSWTSFHAR